MKRFTQIALIMALGCLGMPVLAGPPFNVDDPGTVELHHYQLTAAYISSQSSAGEQQAFPNLSLGYGLTNNIELDLGLGANSVRNTGMPRVAGFGDTTLGFKWRFQEENKRKPQLALGYQIKVPTADVDRGLGSGTVDNSFWLTGAKSYGRWVAFTNVGYNFLGGRSGENNLFYGLGLTYQLTEKLVVGAQVYGNTAAAPGTKSELAWGVGMTYNWAPDRALLVGLGRSEQGFSDLNVYAGLQFTFK